MSSTEKTSTFASQPDFVMWRNEVRRTGVEHFKLPQNWDEILEDAYLYEYNYRYGFTPLMAVQEAREYWDI